MKNGPYELIIAPEGYPGKRYRGRYAYEHTVMWWLVNKTMPSPGYEIHHRNGDHRDNRISNLDLVTSEEHKRIHGLLSRERATVEIKCFGCGAIFKARRSNAKTRSKSTGGRLFCRRSCAAKTTSAEYWRQINDRDQDSPTAKAKALLTDS